MRRMAARTPTTGRIQAVRSKPSSLGTASTAEPYSSTSASLISSFVFPSAISSLMKARSRSACGESESCSAVPQIVHITSSSMSGRLACGSGFA